MRNADLYRIRWGHAKSVPEFVGHANSGIEAAQLVQHDMRKDGSEKAVYSARFVKRSIYPWKGVEKESEHVVWGTTEEISRALQDLFQLAVSK